MKIPKKERTSGSETFNTRSYYLHACNLILAFESTSVLENSVNQSMANVKFSEQ
jgi:hypothetical protein